jgi:aryl-alcohol dehydrogenase-like predicted oxidoreductase
LLPIAQALGVTPAQLAIAWCLLNPKVSTVILGASRVAQLQENLAAIDVIHSMDDEVRGQLAAI